MIPTLQLEELYKVTYNSDGSVTLSFEEYKRFEQNFQEHLNIKKAIKCNDFAKDIYHKLLEYSIWYNNLK